MVSSKDIQKARRMAVRTRKIAACNRCKLSKTKCSIFRPCHRCVRSHQEPFCSQEQFTLDTTDQLQAFSTTYRQNTGIASTSDGRHEIAEPRWTATCNANQRQYFHTIHQGPGQFPTEIQLGKSIRVLPPLLRIDVQVSSLAGSVAAHLRLPPLKIDPNVDCPENPAV